MIDILPTGLDIDDTSYPIETDCRSILAFLVTCSGPDFTTAEKPEILVKQLYRDGLYEMPQEHVEEAILRAKQFVDCDQEDDDKEPARKVMDWEQDEPILLPAVNKVVGIETRAAPYIHWWTFSRYFMGIEERTFPVILDIRRKKTKDKKLEKWKRESYRNNKKLCDVKRRYTEEEQVETRCWNKLLG